MILRSLKLSHVRRHDKLDLEFSDKVNILLGPNACGKTTVLEAIALITSGRAYSTNAKDLLQSDSAWLRIDGDFDHQSRSLKIVPTKSLRPSFEINGQQYSKLSHDQLIPSVWFDPHQTRLPHSSPTRRRDFIDRLLCQLEPEYSTNLKRYRRVLAQRNHLLKQPKTTHESLFVWNLRLVEYGAQITSSRQQLITELNRQLPKTYHRVSNQTKSDLTIKLNQPLPGDNYADDLLQKLTQDYQTERAAGHTLHGPHLDDWQISYSQRNINRIASQGEIRSIILALKLIEVSLLTTAFKQTPLLLLDDIFSELDGARRKALTAAVAETQAFITTTDADVVKKDFSQRAKLITI